MSNLWTGLEPARARENAHLCIILSELYKFASYIDLTTVYSYDLLLLYDYIHMNGMWLIFLELYNHESID